VAQALEVARHLLALRAGLEEDLGARPRTQHRGEPLTTRDDACLDHESVLLADAELTLAFVEIESNRIHGGWPPGLCLVAGR